MEGISELCGAGIIKPNITIVEMVDIGPGFVLRGFGFKLSALPAEKVKVIYKGEITDEDGKVVTCCLPTIKHYYHEKRQEHYVEVTMSLEERTFEHFENKSESGIAQITMVHGRNDKFGLSIGEWYNIDVWLTTAKYDNDTSNQRQSALKEGEQVNVVIQIF